MTWPIGQGSGVVTEGKGRWLGVEGTFLGLGPTKDSAEACITYNMHPRKTMEIESM